MSCQREADLYQKDLTGIDSAQYAHKLLYGMLASTYQGTPPAEVALFEAQKFDTTNAAIWREFGVPYLKRGYFTESYDYYQKSVDYDAATWQGYRGYNYLYFYRDYEKAIADFNATDSLTENFIDYPQGQSVDYMRGIAYYGLGDYENSRRYFNKYKAEILVKYDESWVDTNVFLYYGLGFFKENNLDSAQHYFDKVIKYNSSIADGYFHSANISFRKGKYFEALDLIKLSEKYFNQGSYHMRPYTEVLDQIYIEDIETLKSAIENER